MVFDGVVNADACMVRSFSTFGSREEIRSVCRHISLGQGNRAESKRNNSEELLGLTVMMPELCHRQSPRRILDITACSHSATRRRVESSITASVTGRTLSSLADRLPARAYARAISAQSKKRRLPSGPVDQYVKELLEMVEIENILASPTAA